MKVKDFDSMYILWKEAGLAVANFKTEEDYAEKMIRLNPSSNFVALHKEEIVGTVFGTFNGKRGWIYHLAVHPQFQKRGVGRLLLQKTEQALRKRGAKRVLLGMDKSNLKVLGFYKRCGYKEIAHAVFLGKNV